ncbi:MAG: DEAD/DEAH box helicase [Bacilli bacterium]
MKTFTELGLSKAFGKALFAQGINSPTPIQTETIPAFLDGKNIFAQAQTGSGKTLAFVLPILQKVDRSSKNVQALILTPTRELALQITNEIQKLTANIPEIQSLAVYGGQDVEAQIKKSRRGAQIIVATPGRLIDHLRRETISLSDVSMFILDEGDEMLRMGFLPEVKYILEFIPESVQACLFSATLHPEVRDVAYFFMQNSVEITVAPEEKTVRTIKQELIETTDRRKIDTLLSILDEERPFLAVILCRTIRRASKLCSQLKEQNMIVDELHGELSQAKRERVLKDFRSAKLQYLVATDVAARGLDVEGVTHVINYDIPQDVDSYVHRIGRTGRAGDSGKAITLYAPKDARYVDDIRRYMKDYL